MWNKTFNNHLHTHSYTPAKADPCIYIKVVNSKLVIITVYINNCTIITKSDQLDRAKTMLSDHFKMKDLGKASSVLRIEIARDRGARSLSLQQTGKIDDIIVAMHMTGCTGVHMPMTPGLQLARLPVTQDKHLSLPYQCGIGMLLYLALCLRPDISFAITYLSRFINRYNKMHWTALKHVVRYLQHTCHYAITYNAHIGVSTNLNDAPVGFCDADWGTDTETRCSVSGFIFFLAGGPITWGSKTQHCVALSTTKAELNALSEAAKQALFLRKHQHNLQRTHDAPIRLYNNNQSALTILSNGAAAFHGRMKHYDLKVHHLHNATIAKAIILYYCPTAKMPANLLTKSISTPQLKHLCKIISLTCASTFD